MEWTKSSQETTSLHDILEYPQGWLNTAVVGFITSHTLSIIIIIVRYLWIKRTMYQPLIDTKEKGGEVRIVNNISTGEPQTEGLSKERPGGHERGLHSLCAQ